MSEEVTRNYIDLKINGRLFPSWVVANYGEFKLSKDDKTTGTDLRKYQAFLGKFMSNNSPFRDILVYHGLGSGKSRTVLNIYNSLYQTNLDVVLMIKASMHSNPWMDELNKWLIKKEQFDHIHIVHYDAPNADKQFMETMRKLNVSNNRMFIIDEVHNFIKYVYGNIISGKKRRAHSIYEYIINEKRNNIDTRVICISGTPIIDNPFELSLLFNMLRPNIFPKNESQFNSLFIHGNNINPAMKNVFQRRILGLVSYYTSVSSSNIATKKLYNISCEMSDYQERIYNIYEDYEKKRHGSDRTAFRLYTRLMSNFVFPEINDKIRGDDRPRQNKFNENSLLEKKHDDKKINEYINVLNSYVSEFEKYVLKYGNLKNDFNEFKKYENYDEYHKNAKKSELYLILYLCSAKMLRILFNISLSKGNVIVFSNFARMEGLEIFKVYCKCGGFTDVYEYHGYIDKETRKNSVKEYNNNPIGKIGIMLLGPAGSEGLNLKKTRQVHIMEPHWTEIRIEQAIGRALRQGSHDELLPEERHVDIYKYRSIRKKNNSESDARTTATADEIIYESSRDKYLLTSSFTDILKESAVDCELFASHNMIMQEYSCFKFPNDLLFEKNIGPAYRQDINDDINMNFDFKKLKIKVMKINYVIVLDQNNEKYTKPEQCWLDTNTFIIYHYDGKYPIGKIKVINDIPEKLDKNTYIVDKLIPIPILKKE